MIKCVFFDVGGVLLSKGWDHISRDEAKTHFAFDAGFDARHRTAFHSFECGDLSLDDYMAQVARVPNPEELKKFIFSKQTAIPGSLELLDRLVKKPDLLYATLNNESREINDFRIEHFGLRKYFSAFFSSCFVGHTKPDARIFEMALDVTQKRADECLFIDDTEGNVEAARALGFHVIQFHSPAQLEVELKDYLP